MYPRTHCQRKLWGELLHITGNLFLLLLNQEGGQGTDERTTSFSTMPEVPCTGLLSNVSMDWSRC